MRSVLDNLFMDWNICLCAEIFICVLHIRATVIFCWQSRLFLNCTEKASVFTEKASVSTEKTPVFTKTHFSKEYAYIRESDTIPRKMFVFLRKSNTFLQRNLIHSEKLRVFAENGWPIRAIVKKRRPRVSSFLNKLHLTVFAWLGARSVEGRRITTVWAGLNAFRKHFGKYFWSSFPTTIT